jgi:hypothetical protein
MRKIVHLFTSENACGAVCSALVHLRYKDRDAVTVKYCDHADEEINELLNLIEYAEKQGAAPECSREIIVCGASIKLITMDRLDSFCKLRPDASFVAFSVPWPSNVFKAARYLYHHLKYDEYSAGVVQFVSDLAQSSFITKMDALGFLLPPYTLELVLSNHFTLYPDLSFSPERWLQSLMENQHQR